MMSRSSLLIWSLISLTTIAVVSAETPRTYTPPEVTYIQGLNCDSFADPTAQARCIDMKKQVTGVPQTGSGAPLPPPPRSGSGGEQDRPPHRDDNQSDAQTPPPRPSIGSGTQRPDGQGLGMAMDQLSPTDRATLDQMIRDYLTSKGIDPAKFAEKKNEIKAIRTEARDVIQEVKKESKSTIVDMKKNTQPAIQNKRMEMRGKIRDIRQQSGSGTTR